MPQDDTVEYGWNIAERRRLQRLVHQLRIGDRGLNLPRHRQGPTCCSSPSRPNAPGWRCVARQHLAACAGQVITAYEDRPAEEFDQGPSRPIGRQLDHRASQADIVLYVNTPGGVQGEGVDQYVLNVAHDDMYMRWGARPRAQWRPPVAPSPFAANATAPSATCANSPAA
ncbi:MAG: hypothetical protein R2851_26815 [Caldilineaceae bacterium]